MAAASILPTASAATNFACASATTTASQAVERLERVRDRFQGIVFSAPGDELSQLTASFLVADLLPGMDSAAFIEAADQALYAAKRIGRKRVPRLQPYLAEKGNPSILADIAVFPGADMPATRR